MTSAVDNFQTLNVILSF